VFAHKVFKENDFDGCALLPEGGLVFVADTAAMTATSKIMAVTSVRRFAEDDGVGSGKLIVYPSTLQIVFLSFDPY
jgi:hypothetical protein